MAQLTQGQESTGTPLSSFRDAFLKGVDPLTAVDASQPQTSYEDEDSNGGITPYNPPEFNHQETSVDTQQEAIKTQVQQEQPTELDIETVFVKGPAGERQKLEISYKDRQKIRDYAMKAAGMDKFRKERDLTKKEFGELKQQFDKLSSNFGALDLAFKDKGAKGVFELLGGTGAWDKAIQDEMARKEHLASLSPQEKMQLAMQEREQTHQNAQTALQKKHDEMLAKLESKQEEATARSLESRLTPAFEKVRFRGKLGDDVAEHRIDKAIWKEVTDNLSEYPEDIELTPALIDKEFRNVSSSYRKLLANQTETKVKQVLDRKKEDATQKAQVVVKKGMTANSLESSMANDMKNSNWSAVLQKALLGR